MSVDFPSSRAQGQKLIVAILVGGFVAGTFDLVLAFLMYGRGMPRGIASGLLGSRAFQGGMASWILGVLLHYFIAFGAAAVYCVSSWKLRFLKDNWVVCGLFYGIAIYLVMNLVVLPLSAVPFKVGPFSVPGMIHGLLVHMIFIGLPIAYSLRRFAK
jgi:hypothetical protein